MTLSHENHKGGGGVVMGGSQCGLQVICNLEHSKERHILFGCLGCDWCSAEKDYAICNGVCILDTFHNDLHSLKISSAFLKTSGMKVVNRNHNSPDLRQAWQQKEHGLSCMFSKNCHALQRQTQLCASHNTPLHSTSCVEAAFLQS